MVKAHTSGDIRHLGHVAFKANVKSRARFLSLLWGKIGLTYFIKGEQELPS